jgi:gluconokinase
MQGDNVGKQEAPDRGTSFVVIGHSGCGKTTIGRALAAQWGMKFYDADDYHSEHNVEKMRRGEGLTDADRQPWLDRLRGLLESSQDSVILACSALRVAYRDALRGDAPVRFICLSVSESTLRSRLDGRAGHFAGERLLQSQLAAWESPTTNESDMLLVSADQSPEDVIREITERLGRGE